MAIYKNREVSVMGPNPQANSPETITVSYKDGTHENVKLSDVRFTKAEKDSLIKNYPSKYDHVEVIKDEDIKAVNVGVAPSYDRATYEAVQTKVQQEKQAEMSKKQVDDMKAQAQRDFDAKAKLEADLRAKTVTPAPVAKPVQVR